MGKYIPHPQMKFANEEEERIFLKVMQENMEDYSVAGATGAIQKLPGENIKTQLTKMGETQLKVLRDRNGEFSPAIVERKLSEDIEYKIIIMYARGTSTREISEQIREIYGFDVSVTFISNVTNMERHWIKSSILFLESQGDQTADLYHQPHRKLEFSAVTRDEDKRCFPFG